MRKLLFAALLLVCAHCAHAAHGPFTPVPTPYTVVAAPTDADHFTFAVAGDNRSTGHGYPMPAPFDEICLEIGIVRPPFVLWTGDCIEGYDDTADDANAEYDAFVKGLILTGVPVYNCPGNHEFSLNKDLLLPIYEARVGPLFGSFDYGNSHFIALNTNAINADGTVTAGDLDDAEWAWLADDLKAHASAKNTFVFMHHYMYGPPDPDKPSHETGWNDTASRDRLHKLLAKYHVRAVFCGHDHIYYHEQRDKVDYYISGGAGSPLDAPPDKGGFLHYLLVHVNGDKISVDILQPWRLELTYPRGDANGATTETAWLVNENNFPLTASGVAFHLKPPTPGQKVTVSASTTYKSGKAPKAAATILSTTPSADGSTVTVLVQAVAKNARTTVITVNEQ
ncbi:MAG: metallophosphoesterase family protein [Capsulimonadaceae bacterium]